LTGDFNAVDSTPELRAFVNASRRGVILFDAWREAGVSGPREGATIRGLGPWGRIGQTLLGPRRIDYVLFRPRLKVLRAERIDFDRLIRRETALPSDHFPVLAEFALPATSSVRPGVADTAGRACRVA
jgi:endonuclease/exonuclease/phosphatase family metal-dependent hydrolase